MGVTSISKAGSSLGKRTSKVDKLITDDNIDEVDESEVKNDSREKSHS